MKRLALYVIFATATLTVAPAAQAVDVPSPADVRAAIGHLGPVPAPKDNPLTRAKVALGQRLFEDTMLSGDGSTSCQTCHLPDHGYATSEKLGPAYPSKAERRESPTLINVAYNHPLIWDGRAGSLDKQALGPIGNVLHMNNNLDLLVEQLKLDPSYVQAFKAAYSDGAISAQRLGFAISSFERTLVFDDAPIDRYMDGDQSALTAQEKRGLALFMGKANCIACHNGPDLTDNQFHNLGVPDQDVRTDPAVLASIRFDAKRTGYKDWATLEQDPGRAQISHDPADFGAFRTMGLRNIKDSPPYMHDGALATLQDVAEFYNQGGGGNAPNKSPLLQPLGLTGGQIKDLVAFLEQALEGTQRKMQLE
jgi:cytochrome c peroxidase